MAKRDIFGDDTSVKTDDFSAMLNESLAGAGRNVKVGDNLKGEILTVGKEQTFVSTGTPTDGFLPTAELLDENKQVKYRVGDIIDVVVLKVRNGEIQLRLKGAKGAADTDSLEDAYDMELPVEGKVLEAVKGGFRIQFGNSKAMGFCPVSQIDLRPSTDLAQYVGNKYEFIITRMEGTRNVVVSRRKQLELGKAEAEGLFMEKNKIDDIVEGKISRLDTFGAFMEVAPGVEGLVHISEISWARLAHPSEMLQVGMPVRAKILKMEEDGGRLRISLSIKNGGGESDPWLALMEKFPVGTVLDGTVTKKETFGLFVQIAPGIQGLLPRSKWRDSTEAAAFENKKRGDTVKIRVDEIRKDERKLSFGVPGEEGDESWRATASASSSAPGRGLGTLADLFQGMKNVRKD